MEFLALFYLRDIYTDFHSGYTHQKHRRVPICILNEGHSFWVRWILIVFNLHFFNDQDGEHLFMYLGTICTLLFGIIKEQTNPQVYDIHEYV